MNSIWGTNSSYSFAMIEFFGLNGAYAQFPLLGDYNIRDWNGLANVFFSKKIKMKPKRKEKKFLSKFFYY
jgi:hypothetical protein